MAAVIHFEFSATKLHGFSFGHRMHILFGFIENAVYNGNCIVLFACMFEYSQNRTFRIDSITRKGSIVSPIPANILLANRPTKMCVSKCERNVDHLYYLVWYNYIKHLFMHMMMLHILNGDSLELNQIQYLINSFVPLHSEIAF